MPTEVMRLGQFFQWRQRRKRNVGSRVPLECQVVQGVGPVSIHVKHAASPRLRMETGPYRNETSDCLNKWSHPEFLLLLICGAW
jgi:hypothetical protein